MSSIKKFLQSTLSPDEAGQYEIEYRIKGFDEESLANLKNALIDISNNKPGWGAWEEKKIKDRVFDDGIRVTYNPESIMGIRGSTPTEDVIDSIQKTEINKLFIGKDKLSISKEEKVYTFPDYLFEKHITRIKKRYSFFVQNYIRIDITRVDQDGKIQYEAEVELMKIEDNCIKVFEEIIKNIKKYLPNNEEVIDFFNKTMTGKEDMKRENLIYGVVSRARDLTYKDLVKDKETTKGILEGYKISVKADGEHKFLIFHSSGIWLVFPPKSIKKVGSIQGYESMMNTIIAGELITKDNMRDKNMVLDSDIFIPFDVLCYKGKVTKDINNYDERRKYIETDFGEDDIVRVDNQIKLTIKYKKFFEVNSVESFYKSMNEVLDERKMTFYKEDGLIITPINSGYITSGATIPLSQRSLFKYNDICKWKPPELLTVDLKYEDGELFATKDRDLIDIRDIEGLENMKVIKPDSPGIYEFRPIVNGKNIEFIKLRKREDKVFPNKYDIVLNLYNLSIEPITEETLRGKDTFLMRKYHNIIKRDVFNKAQNNSILIDVGSGKGNDLSKFTRFSKVLMIEPDEENCQELADKSKNYKNISILKSTFEESEKVINSLRSFLPRLIQSKIYISFMFSMPLLSQPGNIENVKRTLDMINKEITDRGGSRADILFVTVNGEIIDRILNSKKYTGNNKSIKLNTIQLDKYKDEQGYDITISDSNNVKKTQREHEVYLEEFFGDLEYKFRSESYNTSDKILSKPEKIYTAAVSFGIADFSGQKNYYYPRERINVSTSEAYKLDGKVYMKNCDKLEPLFALGTNVYRISVLDNGYSLIHSVVKLTSNKYGDSDSEERNKLAYSVGKKLGFKINDLELISKMFKYQIIEFQKSKKTVYGQGDKIIFVYKHTNGTYEPLVRKESDKIISVFKV